MNGSLTYVKHIQCWCLVGYIVGFEILVASSEYNP